VGKLWCGKFTPSAGWVVRKSGANQPEMEAIQTRDFCVAKPATLRADRPDPSLRKVGLLGMTRS
jgi:hypothetical protein